jgi:hypothetical protein
MVHANLIPEFFSLDKLKSKDVFWGDLCLLKKELWDLFKHWRKVQNTVSLKEYSFRALDGF